MSTFRSFPPPEPVTPHEHSAGPCPFSGETHGFCPAQPGDKRAPCPALNALANHGYLPRNGKSVSPSDFISGLRKGYNLTLPFSIFLTFGTYFLLGKFPQALDLDQVAEHGKIEHDASLAHPDTKPGDKFAPLEVDANMLDETVGWLTAADNEGDEAKQVVSATDIARARIQREKRCAPLDSMHAEIARGEMVIALLIFSTPSSLFKGAPVGIPIEWLKEWFSTERMPLGGKWRPSKPVGLLATIKTSREIRLAMAEQRRIGGEDAKAGVMWTQDSTSGEEAAAGEGPDVERARSKDLPELPAASTTSVNVSSSKDNDVKPPQSDDPST